jgi:hypothetical protein
VAPRDALARRLAVQETVDSASGSPLQAAVTRARCSLEEPVARIGRALRLPVPAAANLDEHWAARLEEAELKHGRIALLAIAHIALRAAVGGDDSEVFRVGSAAAAVIADAQGGAWTAWCVLLSACGLVEGFTLSRKNAEAAAAPPRELGAGSVSARLAALRAADRGPKASLPRRDLPPHAGKPAARSVPEALADERERRPHTQSVVRPSAAEYERAAGRVAMLHLAGLAAAILEVLSRH